MPRLVFDHDCLPAAPKTQKERGRNRDGCAPEWLEFAVYFLSLAATRAATDFS